MKNVIVNYKNENRPSEMSDTYFIMKMLKTQFHSTSSITLI